MEAREALRERFERMIDLPAYLGQRGFEPATGQPDAAGLAMTNPATGRICSCERTSRGVAGRMPIRRNPQNAGL